MVPFFIIDGERGRSRPSMAFAAPAHPRAMGFVTLYSGSNQNFDQIKQRGLYAPFVLSGGERGIRTLDGLLTHTPLAGERLQPLGHLSNIVRILL